jgi:hypothetical protein
MGIIDDILKALDRIPVWRRLQEIPGEVDRNPTVRTAG